MSNIGGNASTSTKLTKKDRRRTAWRWIFLGSNTLNYSTLQGTAYGWSMAKSLRKIYPNDDDYVEAMKVEFEYFNTTPQVAPLIIGADLAMQEEEGTKSLAAVRSVKTALMGPLAGIGDSLFWVLYPTIMGSIGGYMALEGNPLGAIIWIIFNILLLGLRIKLFDIGYQSGTRLITDLADKLSSFTEAASVMGLTVVGSLIASAIKIKTPVEFVFGEITLPLQSDIFDRILPAFLPVILTVGVYYLMTKKKVGFLQVILILMLLSIVGSYFGILGV